MDVPKLRLGSVTVDFPIIQGGMGVRVSLSSLAAAVANEGCIGTISSVGLGDVEAAETRYMETSRAGLIEEIRKAKAATNGPIALNVMGALSNSEDLIRTAVDEGIKIIIFGAGLPSRLPAIVPEEDVNLVPIVSSGRGTGLILKTWDKRYGRVAAGIILEGPLAGGHLGFNPEQLADLENYSLEKLLPEVLEAVKPFEDKYGVPIPVIAAGGIWDGYDIARMLEMGAAGVQMGTRFVATHECDVSPEFKQAYIDAREEDVVIIKSPVGMPGRALRNEFLEDVEDGKVEVKCPFKCLATCKMKDARFCIAKALLKSYFGKIREGLIFCGQNVHRIKEIVSVKELISTLVSELKEALTVTPLKVAGARA